MILRKKKYDELIQAILLLESEPEAWAFFRDLLTKQEITEFANRFKVAGMLYQGVPYTQIQKDTGMGSKTIARISKCITKGTGGYEMILDQMHHHADISSAKSSA